VSSRRSFRMSTEQQDRGDPLASVPDRPPQTGQVEEQRLRDGRLLSDVQDVPKYQQPVGNYAPADACPGGLDSRFSLAGSVPLGVSELDPTALATHDKAFVRMANERPHLRDRSYTSRPGDLLAIPDSERPGEGSADLIIGGPPCQGFSVAGKMDPSDERSKHVFHYMDMVE